MRGGGRGARGASAGAPRARAGARGAGAARGALPEGLAALGLAGAGSKAGLGAAGLSALAFCAGWGARAGGAPGAAGPGPAPAPRPDAGPDPGPGPVPGARRRPAKAQPRSREAVEADAWCEAEAAMARFESGLGAATTDPPRASPGAMSRLPFLALQGVAPAQRGALLQSSLEAVRNTLQEFETEGEGAGQRGGRGSEGGVKRGAAWDDQLDDFLGECGRAAATDWLGYVPPLLESGGRSLTVEGAAAIAPTPGARGSRRWAQLGFKVLLEERFALYGTTLFYLKRGGAASAETTAAWQLPLEEIEQSLPFILQDLIVAIAETVAAAYLDEGVQAPQQAPLPEGAPAVGAGAGAATAVAMTGSSPRFLDPQLSSTRRVERFRNQVMLRRWVYRNWDSVAAKFEDRQEVWTLEGGKKGARLGRRHLQLKRSEEFRSLTGVQAWVGLWLETWDVAGPVVQRVVAYLTRAVSFLLVSLIGQSLGLVYRGVLQSLRGVDRQKPPRPTTAWPQPPGGEDRGRGSGEDHPSPEGDFVFLWG